MALQSPRIAFLPASIKQLDQLVTDYPSVDSSGTITAIDAIIDAENTALDGRRTSAKTAIDNETVILKGQWPFADQTAFEAAVDVSTGVYRGTVDTCTYDATQVKADVSAEIASTGSIAAYKAAILANIQAAAVALTPTQNAETCGHCGGSGSYQAVDELTDYKNETLYDTSTDLVVCRTCLSNGVTAGQFIKTGTVTSVGRP